MREEKHQLPQSWTRDCAINMVGNGDKELLRLHQTTQFFDWRWVDDQQKAVVVTVSKFEGCQVQRSTTPENRHLYTGGKPIKPTEKDE